MGDQMNANKVLHTSAIYIQNMNIHRLLCKKFSFLNSVKQFTTSNLKSHRQ